MGFGTISGSGGQTVTFNGGTISGATLDGAGSFATVPTNGARFVNVTVEPSVTVTSNSPNDQFVHAANSGALSVAAGVNTTGGGATVNMNGFTNQGLGSITVGAASHVTAANFQSYGTLTLTPAAVGSGQSTLLTNVGVAPLGGFHLRRQADKRRDRGLRRPLELGDDRAERRPTALGLVALALARQALERRVPVLTADDGAEQREPVRACGEERQQLADFDAGDVGLDRLVRAADLGRSVRLHIPGIELAGASHQKQLNDVKVIVLDHCSLGFKRHPVGQGKSHHSQHADMQKVPAILERLRGLPAPDEAEAPNEGQKPQQLSLF